MNNFHKLLLFIAFIVSLCLGWIGFSQAENKTNHSVNLTDARFLVSPAKLDLAIKPGNTYHQTLTVINFLGRKAEFQVEKETLSNGKKNTNEWIEPEISNFTLDNNEKIAFDITIHVPADYDQSTHYGAIYIATKSLPKENANIEFINRIAFPLSLRPENQLVLAKASILDFFTEKTFFAFGPIDFHLWFKNNGNTVIKPTGQMQIYNLWGSQVANLSVRMSSLLPAEEKHELIQWNRTFLLGIYRANLNVWYGDHNQQSANDTVIFVVFPWPILILLLLIFFLIYRFTKKIAKKSHSDAQTDVIHQDLEKYYSLHQPRKETNIDEDQSHK